MKGVPWREVRARTVFILRIFILLCILSSRLFLAEHARRQRGMRMPRVGYGCWLRRLLGAYVVGLRVWWGRLESHSPVNFWKSEMLVVLYVRDARAWICAAGRLFWGRNGNSQKHVCNGAGRRGRIAVGALVLR